MLRELRILDFAIIDQLDLVLHEGLLAFTGETGAGKSIIMDALDVLLGGKADTTVIRAEAEEARLEASFQLEGALRPVIHDILRREDLLEDEDFLTISREVRREGRSSARINGRSANLALLRELGSLLVDIHGQSEHLSLLDTRAQLGLLDRFADAGTELDAYQETYRQLRKVQRELKDLLTASLDSQQRAEFLNFQAGEIETARLTPGEDEQLKIERDRLANAENLATLARQALTLLDEGTPEAPAATDLLGQVSQSMAALNRIDSGQASLADQAALLEENIADLAHTLRAYLEGIEFNPHRLEEVEERLNLISSLKRKYGGSLQSAMAFAAEARRQLEKITHSDENIASLQGQESQLLNELASQAASLSQKRREAAADMSKRIETELDDLQMASARFQVDFQTHNDPSGLPQADGTRLSFDANGSDQVQFLVAPNPGEGFKPLAKIASGGETSRLMLALKNVLASADQVPTLVFDEIDQGIGGRVGGIVGEKLWQLGRHHQVLVITHLPQLAAHADQHFHVRKSVEDGRTLTRLSHLQGEDRTLELAGMLGKVTEGTLRSAHELLQLAEAAKTGTSASPQD